jgi:predicted dehydrogenase
LTTDGHGGGERPLIEDVIAAVRDGRPPLTSARESWESHRIAFAAMRSAAEGVVVHLAAP